MMGWIWIIVTVLIVAGLFVFYRSEPDESFSNDSTGDRADREAEHDLIDNDRHY